MLAILEAYLDRLEGLHADMRQALEGGYRRQRWIGRRGRK